jgi:hypothetical protein
MSEILDPVTWIDVVAGGICDFCGRPVPTLGVIPSVPTIILSGTDDPDEQLWMPGDWALCNLCRDRVGIKPGDTEAPRAAIRKAHRQGIAEIWIKQGLPLDRMAELMSFYGPEEVDIPPAEDATVELLPGLSVNPQGNMMSIENDVLADFLGLGRNSRELATFVYQVNQLVKREGRNNG